MASSSSTSTAASLYNYDVFINHRGPDVKKTFASHLYRRLLIHGLRVFLDQLELKEGEDLTPQLEGAIKTASVQIAIFSPTYAQSSWCLDELLPMRTTILPVFYNVKPSELRWNRGEYAEALRNLENKKTNEGNLRYESAKLEKWRSALSSIAGKSGFELAKYNGDEGELLDEVVERVLKKVKKPGLEVAKYPTGLDDKIQDFEATVVLQQRQRGKPRILGIVGLGGVGKTTLAKEFFNRKKSDYVRSSFLSDVRDNAAKGSLHLLQRELMNSLTGSDHKINNVDEGTGMLRQKLSSPKALVVLDDVDDVKQVDALFPVPTVLHPESLILITSRNIDVLRGSRVEESSLYNLSGLNAQHSRELFCLHAFSQAHPLPGFEDLVEKFLKGCDGLPLSLIVFGAVVYEKNDRSYWEDQLDRIQRILPTEIKQRLKISFDSLEVEEQHIFLDIACFFIGQNRDTAIKTWEGSGWNGRLGFRNLQSRCLVKVDNEDCIHMHDHLRDLGRDIAEAPELPLRLWRAGMENILQQSVSSQSFNLLQVFNINMCSIQSFNLLLKIFERCFLAFCCFKRDQVIREVRGIRMVSDYDDNDGQHACFSLCKSGHDLLGNWVMKLCNVLHNKQYRFHGTHLTNLQLLDAEDGRLEALFGRETFPNLVWLYWKRCPYSSLASRIAMKNLRVLQVESSLLRTLWQGVSQAPLQLRVLEISSPLSKIPKSIVQLKYLERIVVSGGRQVTLPEEFCHLQSLKFLKLKGCSEMKTLPDCFGNLSSLQHFELSWGKKMKRLPNSFGNLTNLKYLTLEECENLTMSSDTLGNISTLEYIVLEGCEKMKVLPPQVAQQKSLERLILRLSNLKELPSEIGELTELEVLILESDSLEELPPSLGDLRNLKELRLFECRKLKCLPSSARLLTQLTELTVSGCPALSEVPFEMVEGEREALGESSSLDSSIEQCTPRLQSLILRFTKISKLSFSAVVCPNLQYLEVSWCDDVVEIGTLPNTLVTLNLRICRNLREIKGLCGLANLRRLVITQCREVEELASVETLISLEYLSVWGCGKVKSIGGLRQLTKLKTLKVWGCRELEELAGIEDVRSLGLLHVLQCPKVQWEGGVVEQLQQLGVKVLIE